MLYAKQLSDKMIPETVLMKNLHAKIHFFCESEGLKRES